MGVTIKVVMAAAAGAAAGWLFSRFLCSGGACPITSNRPLMAIIGAALGGWAALAGCSSRSGSLVKFGRELLTEQDLQEHVIAPGGAALVDFYATWCGPCRRLAPTLAELETQYAGKVAFFRVDIDRAGELAKRFDIQAVPTLVLFRAGQQADRIQGALGKSALEARLDKLLAGP